MSSVKEPVLAWKISPGSADLAYQKYEFKHSSFSLDNASKNLPGGAYTTLRTYSRTKVMRIEEHFLRLDESAQRVNAGLHPQVELLRPVLKHVLAQNPYPEARVRVTLDLELEPGCFYITLERLHLPPDIAYREGVRVITGRMQRDNPRAKLTNFLKTAAKYRSQLPNGVDEMLMVDHKGFILEGLSSNFFGVNAGTIWTMDEGVLPGITRGAVLEIAAQHKFPVALEGIHITQSASLAECFITSASRGVLPVVQIDDIIIGDEKPGQLTRKLILLFDRWIENNIAEV